MSEGDSGPPPADENLALTDEERQALIALLKRTIDEARFPYSPRLAPLKVILAKLVPPAPLPAPRPPPRAGMEPSHGRGRRRTGVNPPLRGPADDIGGRRVCSRSPDRVVPRLPAPHRSSPTPAEMAERYGAELSVPDWHQRLVCSECGSRRVDFVVTGTEADTIE